MQKTDDSANLSRLSADLARLQGIWIQTYCESDGVRDPVEEYGVMPRLVISGNTFNVTRADGEVAIKGTFSLDAAREPKEIDWQDTFGADAGKTFPAIYVLDGDAFTFCAADENQARPTEFFAGKGQVLRVHRRDVVQVELSSSGVATRQG